MLFRRKTSPARWVASTPWLIIASRFLFWLSPRLVFANDVPCQSFRVLASEAMLQIWLLSICGRNLVHLIGRHAVGTGSYVDLVEDGKLQLVTKKEVKGGCVQFECFQREVAGINQKIAQYKWTFRDL
jgi:hypothetical protein